MSFAGDLKILYHMLLKPVRGDSHAERLESFYGEQADDYDDFRKRLLKGRETLWEQLPPKENCIWVDMGGGTGSNIELFGDDIAKPSKVYVVDLCSSLLEVAAGRFKEKGWTNVVTQEADATKFMPEEGYADVVTFSYSLTMIPNWFAALENAKKMLAPGGKIGVCDFYVSRKYPPNGLKKHGWFTRTIWPPWFATDNVFPSPDHLPFLEHHFHKLFVEEASNRPPYVPFIRAPYYVFVGQKPEQ